MRARDSENRAVGRRSRVVDAPGGHILYRDAVNRTAVVSIVVASVLVGTTAQVGTMAALLAAGTGTGGITASSQEDPWEPFVQYEDVDLGPVDSYWVDEAAQLEPRPVHGSIEERVWADFLRVATPTFAAKVVIEYVVGDDPDADTLAYVVKGEDHEYWSLAVNLDVAAYPDLLIPTLVHEYAHLLSLGRGELDVTATEGTCETVHVWEGCLRDTSMLWAFHQRFWEGAIGAPGPENDDWEVSDPYFFAHEDDFVSDYAAMNVVEDFAESFMVFVMEDPPVGDSVAAEKLRFFTEYPELVAARDRIRAEFGPELGFIP